MTTDLDALLTALYVYLDDDVLPSREQPVKRGPKRLLTDAELVCVAVAQPLLRHDSERHWMRAAPHRIGYLFPRLPCQSEYNRPLRELTPVLFTAATWLAQAVPTWYEQLRLMDGTPVRCGASRATVNRSGLGEIAGYGMAKSHHAFHWGAKLMLITSAESVVCAFSLAHPQEWDERKQVLHLLHVQDCAPGPTPIVCDKGFAGVGVQAAIAAVGHTIVRPALESEKKRGQGPSGFPGWLGQRIEAIIWTLKNQLGLERHAARTTEGLWARVCQRICALNAAIRHNWLIGAPVKRSLIAYDH